MDGNTANIGSDWLDATGSVGLLLNSQSEIKANTKGLTLGSISNLAANNCYQGGPYYPSYTYVSSYPIKVRLALSEIERLRKAAKADDKIKAILAKFTNHIEIAVDFE